MFLDEKIENTYEKVKNMDKTIAVQYLLATIVKEIKEPSETSFSEFLTSLKQIDFAWQLFCKKHNDIEPFAFRNYILLDDFTGGKLKKVLNW